MVVIGLNIVIGLNVVAGLFFLFTGVTGADKPGPVVAITVLWGLMFLGLAAAIWMRQSYARMWTVILYGLIGCVVLLNLLGEFQNPQSHIAQYPLVYGGVYLIWLIFAIGPVVFMLRGDVKDYFLQKNDS